MPLVKRTIQPVHISGGDAVASGVTVVRDELQYFNVTTLANVIRQLGSLSAHVDDIFDELCREAVSITRRTVALSERAERLKVKITQLNPTVEEVLLQDINTRKPFKSSIIKDQQVISLATRPFAITEVYRLCEPPPPLQKLNPYRQDGKDSLKFYTEPGYFFELWCQAMQKDAARNQMRRNKRQRRPPYLPQTIEEEEKVAKDAHKSRSEIESRVHCKDASSRPVSNYNKYGCTSEVHKMDGAVQLRASTVANGRPQSRPNSLELQNGMVLPAATPAALTESSILSANALSSVSPPAPPVRTVISSATSDISADLLATCSSVSSAKSDKARAPDVTGVAAASNSATSDETGAASAGVSSIQLNRFAAESTSKSPKHAPEESKPQESNRNNCNSTVLPSPPPTPPTALKQRIVESTAAVPSPARSCKSEGRGGEGTKSSTPESVVDLPPPPPTPPPQFCQAGSLDSPGTLLPPPPLDDEECFDVIPQGVSPPPPMSPPPEDLAVFNARNEGCSAEQVQALEPASGVVDGVSIASDVSSATVSSGSTGKSDGVAASATADQPLVRDTRSDLLAAIREGIQLRKVEERRLKTQKHRPAGHLDVQSLMEAAFELRRKALEENDSDEDEPDEADEFSGNWSDAD